MSAPSKIRVLTEHTINKIAAGEVIENPASVIKELVENSLDAGATSICIEIQNGGRQLIRISDDGSGMSHDDAILCLERHATSKIKEVDDIEVISTMGFRGEAIPSIASISKFTLLTCPRINEGADSVGTLVLVDGGRLVSTAAAARSPGTTIEVKSLFFNVPVRRKYQKSPSYDIHEIEKMIVLLALGYPNVQFELISDEKQLLKTSTARENLSSSDKLLKRIEEVLGKEVSSPLLPVHFEQPPYCLQGFIAPPSIHKTNRTGQYLFINHRTVISPLISIAVKEGYGTMLPTQRFPQFILHLSLPGSLVDVNVHPQKKEVRLRHEAQLKEMVIRAIQSSLMQQHGKQQELPAFSIKSPLSDDSTVPPYWGPYASLLSPNKKEEEEEWEYRSTQPNRLSEMNSLQGKQERENSPDETSSEAWQQEKILENQTNHPVQANHHLTSPQHPSPQQLNLQPYPQPTTEIEPQLPLPWEEIKVLGTLVGYLIIEPTRLPHKLFSDSSDKKEGGLALVDQRAAWSRIHYEQLIDRQEHHSIYTLLIPVTLQFSSLESRLIVEQLDTLNELGFSLREFGANTFVLDAVPAFIKTTDLQQTISLMIQDLIDIGSSRHLQIKQEELLALAACRQAIPSAKKLTIEEAEGLVRQLLKCNYPTQCPFGKKIALYYSTEELSKLFN